MTTTDCPCCGSPEPPTLLGQLGALLWLRCRACGIDYNVPADDVDDVEEE